MTERNSYIAIARSPDSTVWRAEVLAGLGKVVPVDNVKVERILQLKGSFVRANVQPVNYKWLAIAAGGQ